MMLYGHAMGVGLGWTFVTCAILLAVLLVAATLALAPLRPGPGTPVVEAERVLDERLARGEIDSEEYERLLRTLRAARR